MDCRVDDTDCELMLALAYRKEDETAADEALAELFHRHHEKLVKIARRHFRTFQVFGGDPTAQAEDIVSATWVKLIDKAATYELCDDSDTEASRKHFMAWFFTIMKHLILDEEDRHQRKGEARTLLRGVDMDAALEELDAPLGSDPEPLDIEPLHPLLDTLSEKEMDVLRLIVLELGLNCLTGRMPNGLMAGVAQQMDTTIINVRQLKSRAIKKIKARYEEVQRSGVKP